jgi:general secretion pathway protein I
MTRPDRNRPARGFTLIEVIIALFVVALGIGALLSALVSSADSLGRLRDKSMAEWIALNRISEVRLSGRKPTAGVTSGSVEYGGRPWSWQQIVSDPGLAGMLRIDVQVAPSSENIRPSAAATSPEAARRAFPGVATAYGFIGTAVAQATGIDPDWGLAAAANPGGGATP